MQAQQEATTEVLNDLIKINNDRIAGYEKAISETKDLDVDLKGVFNAMIEESKTYRSQLENEVTKLGGVIATDTTISGKVYRAWMDVKATFGGNSREAILDNCEFGEDAWRRAYESALSSEVGVSGDVQSIISAQYDGEKSSHDLIKKYRDAQSALS